MERLHGGVPRSAGRKPSNEEGASSSLSVALDRPQAGVGVERAMVHLLLRSESALTNRAIVTAIVERLRTPRNTRDSITWTLAQEAISAIEILANSGKRRGASRGAG